MAPAILVIAVLPGSAADRYESIPFSACAVPQHRSGLGQVAGIELTRPATRGRVLSDINTVDTTRMRKKILGVIATLAVASCGGSTDVVVTGPETYMIALHSTQEESSGLEEKARALEEARQYCAKSGKKMETIRAMDIGPGPGGSGQSSSAEVHFRCVTAAAPKITADQ